MRLFDVEKILGVISWNTDGYVEVVCRRNQGLLVISIPLKKKADKIDLLGSNTTAVGLEHITCYHKVGSGIPCQNYARSYQSRTYNISSGWLIFRRLCLTLD